MVDNQETREVTAPVEPDTRRRPGVRDVVVGAVFEAEGAAATVIAGIRRQADATLQDSARRVKALVRRARDLDSRLAARGVAEQDRYRRHAAEALDGLYRAVATATVVSRVVDTQVDRILRPLVASVLDDVLVRLEAEPERIQALIRGQREGMVDEIVARIRSGAAGGDRAVDRLSARLFHRSPDPAPGTPAGPP